MVRIEIDASGRVSIRQPDQKSLPGSMTICNAVDEREATMLVVRYCKRAWDDATLLQVTGRKDEGYEAMRKTGYTGYLFQILNLPPDDALAAVQARFCGQEGLVE